MKTAVVHISQTGKTKKVAQAIAAGIEGRVDVMSMREADSLDDYDLVFTAATGHQIRSGGHPEHCGPAMSSKMADRYKRVVLRASCPDGQA
jgi:menaquinone-dependent protoporphyrinogen IX oxidase